MLAGSYFTAAHFQGALFWKVAAAGVRPCVAFKAVSPLNAKIGGFAAGQDVLE